MKVPLLKLLLSSLLVLALPHALHGRPAGQGSVEIPPPPSSTAEFPPQEETIWRLRHTGMTAKRISVLLAHAPDSLEAAKALMGASRFGEVTPIGVQLIIDTPPENLAGMLNELGPTAFRHPPTDPEQQKKLRGRLELARNRLPTLPRSVAAEVGLRLLFAQNALARAERPAFVASLRSFVAEYAGTDAALDAEIEVLLSDFNMPTRIEALGRFAAAHPGTVAAARALYQKAFELSHNPPGASGEDPTDRFMQVLEITRDLESGRYPRCYWTDQVESAVIGFFANQPKYGEGSIDRLLEAYRDFAQSHPALHDINPLHYSVGYVISSRMGELFGLKGEGPAGVERTLIELEKGSPDPWAVRYLRALWYAEQARSERASAQSSTLREKATKTLEEVYAQGKGLYQRKALATLACMHYVYQDYPKARDCFVRYARSYPQSAYAWVATLRAGLCEERMGQWRSALENYQVVAKRDSSEPLASILGAAYSAKAFEALGQFDTAARAYERAVDEWDSDYGRRLSLSMPPARFLESFEPIKDDTEIIREALVDRVARLKKTIATPDGSLLEQGRWLLGRGQGQEAVATLEQFVARYPDSPNVREAFYLMHQARLQQALELADVENPKKNEADALKALEALAGARPYDFFVGAAKITKACLLWKQGDSGGAETVMLGALEALHASQASSQADVPSTELEKDVAEIRRTVFRPMGAPFYSDRGGAWNAFSWPASHPRFLLVSSAVSVVFPDRSNQLLTLRQTFPDLDNVIFLDSDQIAFFASMMTKLGGNRRRQPTAVMETPNQPIGPSMDIIALLNKFFPARPGHWSGWEFETYPVVRQIRFADPARTKAFASVAIGFSGADVVLEKNADGIWVVKDLVNHWIT